MGFGGLGVGVGPGVAAGGGLVVGGDLDRVVGAGPAVLLAACNEGREGECRGEGVSLGRVGGDGVVGAFLEREVEALGGGVVEALEACRGDGGDGLGVELEVVGEWRGLAGVDRLGDERVEGVLAECGEAGVDGLLVGGGGRIGG